MRTIFKNIIDKIKNTNDNKGKDFFYNGQEVSWEGLPLEVRKHDYPYYFDSKGKCTYPNKAKNSCNV